MKPKYILSLDIGTGSTRAILFDKNAHIRAISQKEITPYYPRPGWVEQDPMEILESTILVIKEVIAQANISHKDIEGIGLTNQRETVILWDRKSGKPVYQAIVWQDTRTQELCTKLKKDGAEKLVTQKTGLVIDPYFSASKITWILDHINETREKARKGNLLFGTVDTWIIWHLTNRESHITDPSNASRTLLYNTISLEWDQELLDLFDIPKEILPLVVPSSGIAGTASHPVFKGAAIPISGIAGDQQAALFGQVCFTKGMVKNTYGTGCFMLMNTGFERPVSKSGLLSTVAWQTEGKTEYALEGSVFTAGAALKWLRDDLQIISDVQSSEKMAIKAKTNGGVYFIPAFSGLGAPYWNLSAKGMITGITPGINKNHIVRATLEAIAYRTKDVLMAMEADTHIKMVTLKVDGGASSNNFLMQFQADLLNVEVERPQNQETTALGAAFLAGLSVGFWTKNQLSSLNPPQKTFLPKMKITERNELYENWLKVIRLLH